jgi:hypothetical protein
MDILERPPEAMGKKASPLRWHRMALWMTLVGVAALLLAIAAISWAHSTAVNRHWPERISIAGRDYDYPASVPAATARAEAKGWQQLGTVGPDNNPVYGPANGGLAPTIVVVQTSFDTYESYSLMGGP